MGFSAPPPRDSRSFWSIRPLPVVDRPGESFRETVLPRFVAVAGIAIWMVEIAVPRMEATIPGELIGCARTQVVASYRVGSKARTSTHAALSSSRAGLVRRADPVR
ncbi:hypothetical protein GCM10009533_00700 [Saccharopolyspora spinosporotrichia]|uniref:Uncharacterized protein n=1 Tax=Saccharopolyspora erythraea TaxID=1836 RepID=A0ABN1BUD6_SACER